MRKYPTAAFLERKSSSTYTFNGTSVSIPKDTIINVPVYAIHKDPNIYPNPEKFDPERFDEISEKARHPMNYLPFGDGPRNCIGKCKKSLNVWFILLVDSTSWLHIKNKIWFNQCLLQWNFSHVYTTFIMEGHTYLYSNAMIASFHVFKSCPDACTVGGR